MSRYIRPALVLAIFGSLAFFTETNAVKAQSTVSESADTILRMMSDYLGGQPKFSLSYDSDTEIVTGDGQKLQMAASGKMVVGRASGAYITRDGPVAHTEIFFDGKKLTLFGKEINSYFEVPSEGGIDQAINDFRIATGLYAAGADLIVEKPYDILIQGVTSGEYVGDAFIGGVKCYHVAFREADIDWQLWVRADDKPVPMKYVITTKWVTGAPQFTVRMDDWNFEPKIADAAFKFSPPQGATKMESIEVDEAGELVIVEAK